MKRLFAALLAGLMLLSACSAPEEPEPEPQGTGYTRNDALTVNLHLGGEPSTLDPAFATPGDGGSYVLHLFEGLTALSWDGKAGPAAAESWETEEDKNGLPVYTFTLRENYWSDGTPVTAEDFVYAWLRVLDPVAPTPNAYQLYPIHNAQRYHEGVPANGEDGEATVEYTVKPEEVGIEAVDEKTLKVTLEGPCPDFAELLALPPWCPVQKAAVEANPDTWSQSPSTCVTNGAFLLREWTHDQSLVLLRNDQHPSGELEPTFLNFVLSEDAEALYNDFQAGRLQYASTIPTLSRPEAEDAGTLSLVPRAGVYSYLFNTEKAPFDDERVRRAISLAIDREALTKEVGVDLVSAYGLVPNGIADTRTRKDFCKTEPPLEARPSNLTEAQRLLKEAGYPGGAGFPQLRFITNDSPAHLAAAETIRQQLAEGLGIDMAISALSTQDFQAAREGDGWDLARAGSVGSRIDPAPYLMGWTAASGANYGGFQNEDYDKLLTASYDAPETPPEEDGEAAEKDPPAEGAGDSAPEEGEEQPLVIPDTRMGILHAMEKLLVYDQAAVIPLWQYQEPVLMAKGFSGVGFSPLGYRIFTWVEWTPQTPDEPAGDQPSKGR
ncbi:MAG: peptide ABC transporter substrate-binding protein [Angelakisella sp.]|jgi:oligopeptide transport system substrate-binding protein|nr:peptide ABC transporter substrate-binding protein [Angelakisella sp.]